MTIIGHIVTWTNYKKRQIELKNTIFKLLSLFENSFKPFSLKEYDWSAFALHCLPIIGIHAIYLPLLLIQIISFNARNKFRIIPLHFQAIYIHWQGGKMNWKTPSWHYYPFLKMVLNPFLRWNLIHKPLRRIVYP